MKTLHDNLPAKFVHVEVDNHRFRVNLLSEDDIDMWIQEYSSKSSTSWRSKWKNVNSTRFVCRKVFVCHRSAYKRVHANLNKRGKSKNSNCKAEIDILVKKETRDTRKKDKFMKSGLHAIIHMRHEHNHDLDTAEELSFLKPTAETRSKFEDYFSEGLGVSEAMKKHESKLALRVSASCKEMNNAAINPRYNTVSFWHTKWLEKKMDNCYEKIVTNTICHKEDSVTECILPTIIHIRHEDYHALDTDSSSKPMEETQNQFESYFSDGLGISEALMKHESKLEQEFSASGNELDIAAINPNYRSVQHWYRIWLEKQLGDSVTEVLSDNSEEMEHNENGEEEEEENMRDDTEEQKKLSKLVLDTVCSHVSCFRASPSVLRQFLQRLNQVKTTAEWESFLDAAGS